MSYKDKLHSLPAKLEKDSIMILFSTPARRRNGDVQFRYRNHSNLIYLTGLNEENFILCVSQTGEFQIYMTFPDPLKERWQGKMISPEDVAQNLGVSPDCIKEHSVFKSQLSDLLKNKNTLYVDFNLETENLNELLSSINSLNRNNRDKTHGPLRIVHIGQILNELRTIKSPLEIQKIKQAIQVTGNGFTEVMKWTRKTKEPVFEYQIKSKIEECFGFFGSQDLAYPTIVAGGNNANYLHYEKCTEMISDDSLVLIDAGTEWNHYASDITRTFPLRGKFSHPQKELYSIVLEAQKKAIESCIPEHTIEEMHSVTVKVLVENLWELGFFKNIPDIANDGKQMVSPSSVEEVIEKKYYRLYYMHYTSHYLGLDVHDVGRYYTGDTSRNFSEGMVFTIEPGVYIQKDYDFLPEKFRGIGIRIEDDVTLESGKPVNLSAQIPKEIEDLENL